MGILFDCDRSVVTKHLKNIFDSGELNESAVCAKFAHTASDGKNYMPLSAWAIASIVSGQRNSVSGPQVCFVNMLFVAMCWTGNEWRMARFWMRTTLSTC